MFVPAGRKRFTSGYEMVKHTIVEISAIVAAQLRKISLCGVWWRGNRKGLTGLSNGL
jgi:hypothetical protein